MEEKVKLNFDLQKSDLVTRWLTDFCDKANSVVIPLMKSLGVCITLESVIRYAENSDALNADYLEAEKAKSKVENAYLLQIVERNAAAQFDEAFDRYPYDDFETRYPGLLMLSKERICVNTEAVREFCTIYLREDQREVYDRYIKAVGALNDFYRGKAQDGVFIGTQFPVKDGKVFPSQLIDFDYYK